uniref:Uncharacterized protein n=1 Tax=Rhizophora mucronata TaxID=61149 RepID=A0A2P2M7C6_RHIMU
MALFIPSGNGGGGGTILYNNPTRHHPYTHLPHRRPPQVSLPLTPRGPALHVVSAKKFSPRTGRLDSKNRRSSTTTTKDLEKSSLDQERTAGNGSGGEVKVESVVDDDGFVIPKLPGEESDFWEGPQWDGLGFFLQYLWAFGIVFALIACGIAVATYNEGATDFKDTPIYKESIQSQDLLDEPETSNSDVFESNPTEVAPSLE